MPFAHLVSALLLSGTFGASPVYGAGSYVRAEDARVGEIAYRLATRGRALCEQKHPVTGLLLHHLGEYRRRDHPKIERSYRLTLGPAVLAVAPGSAAASAGLRAGDVLLSVNDQVLPEAATIAAERNSAARRRLMARADLLIHDALREGPARLRLRRGAETIEPTLLPSYGCPSFARLARSPQLNAFADGRYAIATTRLLDFVRSDDELAIALAHEMSHNVLGHPAALEAKGASRGGSSSAGAGHQAIKDREMEADRLGLKLAWAAGYDIGAAPAFWARLRQATLAVSSTTHPGLDEREDLLRQVLAELETLKPGTHGPELRESALAER